MIELLIAASVVILTINTVAILVCLNISSRESRREEQHDERTKDREAD